MFYAIVAYFLFPKVALLKHFYLFSIGFEPDKVSKTNFAKVSYPSNRGK